ncbi:MULTISPECIES: DUF1120 domain-containing protein [Pseudomonas]|jgi:type 1 fimbria pilin|uniref:DUF1120 domain-containing protein n=1 Tax=Pseudomonas kielensis TaxID=2762577 RepID=A0A7X1GDA7_9PSED|nr:MULTISPECIES: DUF1120 domain-containing protein [Pseudomonas]MBC2689945.1 DUF1120 domain-containing protein [Pseudomonas kielensis]NBB32282.1 DUF1120 domain-containing protein [Pseudomonas sp. BC115LW]UZM13949.1 DUF1120 domain-containing protein [Pseudomonas kielensis]WKL54003.1 DUF1120 domain-containing protein [Pseudomonas kielensis]
MIKQLTILATALLLGATTSVFAASSTDLTITGTITPAACTPTLENGGVVDYRRISAKDLNATTNTQLDEQTLELTVSCGTAATQFAIQPIDNRSDSQGPMPEHFGLGIINGSEKLGFYTLTLTNLNADVPSRLIQSADGGNTWSNIVDNTAILRESLIAVGSLTPPFSPSDITSATMDITVKPSINPTDGLTLTDEVQLDGSATLQIVYL